MKYQAKVEVSLKPGHTDPEGNTTKHLLRELGYSVEEVNVNKVYSIQFEASSKTEAQSIIQEMAKRLLANPTKDNFVVTIEERK